MTRPPTAKALVCPSHNSPFSSTIGKRDRRCPSAVGDRAYGVASEPAKLTHRVGPPGACHRARLARCWRSLWWCPLGSLRSPPNWGLASSCRWRLLRPGNGDATTDIASGRGGAGSRQRDARAAALWLRAWGLCLCVGSRGQWGEKGRSFRTRGCVCVVWCAQRGGWGLGGGGRRPGTCGGGLTRDRGQCEVAPREVGPQLQDLKLCCTVAP